MFIDEKHFNDFVMDAVISEIRAAKFVIADFTVSAETVTQSSPSGPETSAKGGSRGGVYFEAGYARGLGRSVIHTCRNDAISRNRLHFDTQQINTIFWENDNLETGQRPVENAVEDPTFVEQLAQRVLATIGRGPIRSPIE